MSLIFALTGCIKTEKSLIDDISKTTYESSNCTNECSEKYELQSNAILAAQAAGISQDRITAAEAIGSQKAAKEKAKIDKLKEIELTNKCKAINRNVCHSRCCGPNEKPYSTSDWLADRRQERELRDKQQAALRELKLQEENKKKEAIKHAMDSYRYFYDLSNPNDYPLDVYPPDIRKEFQFSGCDYQDLNDCITSVNKIAVKSIYDWVKYSKLIDQDTKRKATVDYDVLIQRNTDFSSKDSVDNASNYAKDAAKYYYPQILSELISSQSNIDNNE
jgi:hypothetical protein